MTNANASSFRDPAGYVFIHNGVIYRTVKQCGAESYEMLMQSGLYYALINKGWLIPHVEIDSKFSFDSDHHKILKPDHIDFISYPYEWSFSQLKDAAILTLNIQQLAISHGMTLKDASAFNIQFYKGRPILIDTLSFEKYYEGNGWFGYNQFCKHFFSPLVLMAKVDINAGLLSKIFIDGPPLKLVSSMLSFVTWFSPSIFFHIHLHARVQSFIGKSSINNQKSEHSIRVSKSGVLGLIDGLKKAIEKLNWQPTGTEWYDYYQKTNYSNSSMSAKFNIVNNLLDEISPRNVWDFGANIGRFSRLASSRGIETISFDIDPAAIEISYNEVKVAKEISILPLICDLTNPSPAIGWANNERASLHQRGPADCIFALALIHHLAISNNLPLPLLADYFSCNCRNLIIEFIPKSDSQVKNLLRTRKNIYSDYTESFFEESFLKKFTMQKKVKIPESDRTIYWLKNISQTIQ